MSGNMNEYQEWRELQRNAFGDQDKRVINAIICN